MTVAGFNAVEAIADEPLTTKEGWRRFVDRQPHPPVLLGAVRLAKLSERDRAAYDDGRRGYHADLPLVSTPIIRKVISTLFLGEARLSRTRNSIKSSSVGLQHLHPRLQILNHLVLPAHERQHDSRRRRADGQNDLGNLRHLHQTAPQCRTYGCTDTTRSTSSLSGSRSCPTSGLPAMPKGAARRANRRAA